jgi:hypothetical protein
MITVIPIQLSLTPLCELCAILLVQAAGKAITAQTTTTASSSSTSVTTPAREWLSDPLLAQGPCLNSISSSSDADNETRQFIADLTEGTAGSAAMALSAWVTRYVCTLIASCCVLDLFVSLYRPSITQ